MTDDLDWLPDDRREVFELTAEHDPDWWDTYRHTRRERLASGEISKECAWAEHDLCIGCGDCFCHQDFLWNGGRIRQVESIQVRDKLL